LANNINKVLDQSECGITNIGQQSDEKKENVLFGREKSADLA